MTLFSKHITDINTADINYIVSSQVHENSEIEFKDQLPAKKGNDPWMGGDLIISEYARNKLLEEIIAFANTYGGTLVLGISESADKPSRASGITLIPNCVELADRIRLQCRDCIEPQLPLIETQGIQFTEDKGVVVIKVPKSRMAPHRHTVTRECYIRRFDRTEKMSMREIQDLTLNLERGVSKIEGKFTDRSSKFSAKYNSIKTSHLYNLSYGIRFTLIPLNQIYINHVHAVENIKPPDHTFNGNISNSWYNISTPSSYLTWKPILRGSIGVSDEKPIYYSLEINCDGLIEYLFIYGTDRNKIYFSPGLFMAITANSLCAAEKFRRATNSPDTEYGLEIEINCLSPTKVTKYGSESEYETLGPLPQGETQFPRYSIGSMQEFSILTQLIENDFWNAAGHSFGKNPLLIDFDSAFKELNLA